MVHAAVCVRPAGGRAAPPAGRGSRSTPAPVLVRASGSWREGEHDAQLATGRRSALAAGGALLSGLLLPGVGGGFGAARAAEPAANGAGDSIYDLSAMQYGEEVALSKYRGQVRLSPRLRSHPPALCVRACVQPTVWQLLPALRPSFHPPGTPIAATQRAVLFCHPTVQVLLVLNVASE